MKMHCYDIPTIDPDLRHEETILQAINAFEFLNEVIDDVFGKVNKRIEVNRERLQRLDARIEKVNGDVAKLKETKEAIVIYSPCRYPGADLESAVLPTFTSANGIRLREGESGSMRDRTYVPSHSYQEKIQFYHVKSSMDRHRIYSFEGSKEVQEGKEVQFLDSILLFNSRDFAVDYKGAEEKSRSGKKTPGRIHEERIISSSSPIIRNRSKKKGQEIFYTPVLNDAPKIDVPVDLPDLPGIVSNIQYAGNHTLIAPSLQLAAIADQLPELEDLSTKEAKETVLEAVNVPPPVPSSMSVSIASASSVSSAAVIATPIPPPPPPPPPPPAEILAAAQPRSEKKTDENDGKPVKKKDPISTAATGDAHFNLMEAIRNAGGLKKANLRHSEIKEGKTDSTKPSKVNPQNFIDDLHSKLQMRRKGISGARENQEPGNVIDRLSALIPPPPPKLDASASESNDEDWD